jgi:hypothetical protein
VRDVPCRPADDKKANLGHNHVAAAIKDAEQVLAR